MPIEQVRCENCGSGDVRQLAPDSYRCEHCQTRFHRIDPTKRTVIHESRVCQCGNKAVARCVRCHEPLCKRCKFTWIATVDNAEGYKEGIQMRFIEIEIGKILQGSLDDEHVDVGSLEHVLALEPVRQAMKNQGLPDPRAKVALCAECACGDCLKTLAGIVRDLNITPGQLRACDEPQKVIRKKTTPNLRYVLGRVLGQLFTWTLIISAAVGLYRFSRSRNDHPRDSTTTVAEQESHRFARAAREYANALVGTMEKESVEKLADVGKLAGWKEAAQMLAEKDAAVEDLVVAKKTLAEAAEKIERAASALIAEKRPAEKVAAEKNLGEMMEEAKSAEEKFKGAVEKLEMAKNNLTERAILRALRDWSWTDSTGTHVETAQYVGFAGQAAFQKVNLKKLDGSVITLPFETLSKEDQTWIDDHWMEYRRRN